MTRFVDIPRPTPREDTHFTFDLHLETVSPVLGGGARTRSVDAHDPIRAPSVRGHLRTWWRATQADVALGINGQLDAEVLYEKERRLWGGAGGNGAEESPTKSLIQVRTRDVRDADEDTEDVSWNSDDFYALWPAASQRRGDVPPAPRWRPGLKFRLTVSGPKEHEAAVRDALRAWLLFGGYGGRTRRGLGALRLREPEARKEWLPKEATVKAIAELFPQLAFGRLSAGFVSDMPQLRGAGLAIGQTNAKGLLAARMALDWLKDFRQGQPGSGAVGLHDAKRARVRGVNNRPSISNWPEPDKMRHIQRGRWTHSPRYNNDPAWPRGGFGLPIQVQWQTRNRNHGGPNYREPSNFQLQWFTQARGGGETYHDRLASALIVGPLQLQDDRFVPFALWLHRGFPKGGRIMPIYDGHPDTANAAPFDKLLGDQDQPLFAPLDAARDEPEGYRLRTAFMGWLESEQRLTEVIQ